MVYIGSDHIGLDYKGLDYKGLDWIGLVMKETYFVGTIGGERGAGWRRMARRRREELTQIGQFDVSVARLASLRLGQVTGSRAASWRPSATIPELVRGVTAGIAGGRVASSSSPSSSSSHHARDDGSAGGVRTGVHPLRHQRRGGVGGRVVVAVHVATRHEGAETQVSVAAGVAQELGVLRWRHHGAVGVMSAPAQVRQERGLGVHFGVLGHGRGPSARPEGGVAGPHRSVHGSVVVHGVGFVERQRQRLLPGQIAAHQESHHQEEEDGQEDASQQEDEPRLLDDQGDVGRHVAGRVASPARPRLPSFLSAAAGVRIDGVGHFGSGQRLHPVHLGVAGWSQADLRPSGCPDRVGFIRHQSADDH